MQAECAWWLTGTPGAKRLDLRMMFSICFHGCLEVAIVCFHSHPYFGYSRMTIFLFFYLLFCLFIHMWAYICEEPRVRHNHTEYIRIWVYWDLVGKWLMKICMMNRDTIRSKLGIAHPNRIIRQCQGLCHCLSLFTKQIININQH